MGKKKIAEQPVTARQLAFEALLRVELDEAFLDRVLPASFKRHELSPEDRGLATELAYGVLRRKLTLDRYLQLVVDRPLPDVDLMTLTALRLGLLQLLFLDRIPAHAAVHETIETLKQRRQSSTGLVNAVLRRFADPVRRPLLPQPSDETEAAARASACPPWMIREMSETARRFGGDLGSIAASLVEPAHPTLRVVSKRLDRDRLLERLLASGADAEQTAGSPVGVHVHKIGDISTLPGFGFEFIAQDEAAQQVTALAAAEHGPTLDACAAPGGKTIALWDYGHEPVTAMDVHRARVELLEKSLAAAQVPCKTILASAEQPPFPANSFQTVLLDAPCTGSGTLRRHPEIKTRLSRDDVGRLAKMQAAMLRGLAPLVRPGGALIYSVCSVFLDEGPKQVAGFIASDPRFALEEEVSTFAKMAVMDGFYGARLRRVR